MVCKKEELSTDQPCSSCCAQLNFREVSAVCPTLKLNGERRLLLLRFRPHTVLSLVRNPESAPNRSNTPLSVLASRHQCLSHINEQFRIWKDTQTHSCAQVNSRRMIETSSCLCILCRAHICNAERIAYPVHETSMIA